MRRAPIKLLPAAEYLRAVLIYDRETGDLTWRRREGKTKSDIGFNHRVGGKKAGTLTRRGYLQVGFRLDGKLIYFLAHRIIWKMMTGEDPPKQVDHIDGDRGNNRWENFRSASHGQNRQNAKLQRDNKSGVKGVSWDKYHQRWVAQIGVNGLNFRIGRYRDIEDAETAILAARADLHGEFARAA